jgi:hypothetical protein
MSAFARCLAFTPLVIATHVAAQAPRGALTLDSAAAILGDTPAVIPGASVLEVRRPVAYYPQVVIVEQLASGDTVTLTERPARLPGAGWTLPPAQPPAPAVSGLEAARVVPAGPVTADRIAQINYQNSWSGTAAQPGFGGPIIMAPLPHIAPADPLTRYIGRLVVTIGGKLPRKALQATLRLASPGN